MQWAKRWIWASLVSVCWVGCAGAAKPVRSVAEYDLACGNVEVTRVEDDRYAAFGCGRGAMYVESCDGSGCRWARMRHGHESEVAGQGAPVLEAGPREIVPAPAPEQRQVQPAPAPEQRQVIPAPAPSSDAAPAASSGGEVPAASSGAEALAAASDPNAAQAQLTPLTQGDLTAPYQAEVPTQATTQQVAYAPPQPLVEARPAPPAVTYVWVGGYWWWSTPGWTWLPGYWCPPRPGFVWIGSNWYWNSGYWWYYPGGWGYPGTRTVVYAPAPRPTRVVSVRTFRPHREIRPSPAGRSDCPHVSSSSSPRPGFHAAPPAYRPSGSPLVRYPSSQAFADRRVGTGTPGVPRGNSAWAQQRPAQSAQWQNPRPSSQWQQQRPASSSQWQQQRPPGVGRVVQPNTPRPQSFSSSPSRSGSINHGSYNSKAIRPGQSSPVPSGRNVRPSNSSSLRHMNSRSVSPSRGGGGFSRGSGSPSVRPR